LKWKIINANDHHCFFGLIFSQQDDAGDFKAWINDFKFNSTSFMSLSEFHLCDGDGL